MTEAQQRITIAEACGWKHQPEHDVNYKTSAGNVYPETWRKETEYEDITACEDGLPNYLNDLNAMYDAESILSPLVYHCFLDNLCIVCFPDNAEMDGSYLEISAMVHSSARQRAEAFLKTLSKWID